MRTRFVAVAAVIVTLTGAFAAPAQAATPKFKNCTAMHKTYKNGVAKSAHAATHAKPANIRVPKVSTALYAAHRGLDRDKDGVACEVKR